MVLFCIFWFFFKILLTECRINNYNRVVYKTAIMKTPLKTVLKNFLDHIDDLESRKKLYDDQYEVEFQVYMFSFYLQIFLLCFSPAYYYSFFVPFIKEYLLCFKMTIIIWFKTVYRKCVFIFTLALYCLLFIYKVFSYSGTSL